MGVSNPIREYIQIILMRLNNSYEFVSNPIREYIQIGSLAQMILSVLFVSNPIREYIQMR